MKLKPGDRIRLKVRTVFGWKGIGIVVEQQGDIVRFFKEGDTRQIRFPSMASHPV